MGEACVEDEAMLRYQREPRRKAFRIAQGIMNMGVLTAPLKTWEGILRILAYSAADLPKSKRYIMRSFRNSSLVIS